MPQALRATWLEVASTRPRATAWPLVSAFMASRAMLKPEPAWSMARTLMVLPFQLSS